jgi:hypothetical protein
LPALLSTHAAAFLKPFSQFPVRPRSMPTPSKGSSPQTIFHVRALHARSFPMAVAPSYFLYGFHSVHLAVSLSPRPSISTVSVPSTLLARSLLTELHQAISNSFLSVQTACSLLVTLLFEAIFTQLLRTELSPNYIHGFLLFRTALTAKLSRSYFARCAVSAQASASLPHSEAS